MYDKIRLIAVLGIFVAGLIGHAAAAEVENLLLDPDFDKIAINDWQLEVHTDFVAATMELDKEALTGKYSAYIDILDMQPDAEVWRLQFKQFGIRVKQGQKYTWTFWAKSEEGKRPVQLSVGMEVDPWDGLGGSKALVIGDEWQEYQLTFTATQDFHNTRLAIQLAGSDTNLWIDHARFYEGDYVPDDEVDADPPDPEPGKRDNMINNPEFDSGTVFWSLEVHADFVEAIVVADRSMAIGDDHSARIDINNIEAGAEVWRLQFKQIGHSVEAGETYTWSFWAKTVADGWREGTVSVGMETDPWAGLGLSETFELEADWQEYHFTFVATESFDNTRLAIQLASSQENVWVDHVRFYEGEYDEEDFDEIRKWRPVTPAGKLPSTWGDIRAAR